MAAIITDQIRLLNAKNFVAGVTSTTNAYYSFIGLPNPTDIQTDWNTDPPSPKDNFTEENDYWDNMVALKKVSAGDCRQVVTKRVWSSGTTYDMYRGDYSRSNTAPVSGATNLYNSTFYVINADYRVYICLFNNANPENNNQGGPSLDEPTFTDLEPRAAGSSGDGYIWKYLYTVRPSEAIKFDSTDYIPVPDDWFTSATYTPIRENADASGQLKICTITNRGVGLGTANITYTNVPIMGDGQGGKATIVINNDSKVETVTVSDGGSGYTFGSVDLAAGGVPTGTTTPTFNVIIPPPGGHGKDVYLELGALNALAYARFENDSENPDFVTGQQFARVGILKNPQAQGSDELLISEKASAVYALRLTGAGYSSAVFNPDEFITQTIGIGSTAVGRVISYDQNTGVLKYWQDRTTAGFTSTGLAEPNPIYGFRVNRFSHLIEAPGTATGGSYTINGGSVAVCIYTGFQGVSTVINNRTYYLGQNFVSGVAQPEIKKYSGEVVYVDNRPSITRSSSQKEDLKIILQF